MKINSADVQFREAPPVHQVQSLELDEPNSGELINTAGSSEDYHEVSSLAQRALESVNSPQSKLDELRRQFEAGAYKPDSMKVGQKLVESMFE